MCDGGNQLQMAVVTGDFALAAAVADALLKLRQSRVVEAQRLPGTGPLTQATPRVTAQAVWANLRAPGGIRGRSRRTGVDAGPAALRVAGAKGDIQPGVPLVQGDEPIGTGGDTLPAAIAAGQEGRLRQRIGWSPRGPTFGDQRRLPLRLAPSPQQAAQQTTPADVTVRHPGAIVAFVAAIAHQR